MVRFPDRKAKPAEPESLLVALELDSIDVAIDVDLDELEPTGGEVELTGDELELTDDDFILLEAAPPGPPLSRSILRAALAAVPDGTSEPHRMGAREARPIWEARLDTLRTKAQRASSTTLLPAPASVAVLDVARDVRRPPFARASRDAEAESSVADECLASIAAAASHARASSPLIEDISQVSSSMPVALPIASLARSSEWSLVDDLLDAAPVPRSSQRSPVEISRRGAGRRSSSKHLERIGAAALALDGDYRTVVVFHLARVAAPGRATAAVHAVVAVVVFAAVRVSVGAGPLACRRG